MKDMDLHKIKKHLIKALDEKRYEHTLGVAYTAAALAMCHGADQNKAYLAGLLHDCAKCMENDKKIHICEKHGIEINEAERKNPYLLHAKVGAYLAENKYNVEEGEILNAVLYHTTGKPDMTLMEKIVYIADYIEPGRNHAANLTQIRRLAFCNLDAALIQILEDTLDHLEHSGRIIDPMTQKTYDFYKGLNE
ncbi:MAG: bis(5'-nucleosyl)-tetraphosphatase (symmetrical) YqeK [Lachnospiraceae bacterium]